MRSEKEDDRTGKISRAISAITGFAMMIVGLGGALLVLAMWFPPGCEQRFFGENGDLRSPGEVIVRMVGLMAVLGIVLGFLYLTPMICFLLSGLILKKSLSRKDFLDVFAGAGKCMRYGPWLKGVVERMAANLPNGEGPGNSPGSADGN